VLQHFPAVRTITDLTRFSLPLTFADASDFAIEPPPGVEALTTALSERCAITIVYKSGWQRPRPRKITPRLVLEVNGVTYVMAQCRQDEFEKTFPLDRIRKYWLEEEGD
jgi:predicted DNA-binding transcriptional regulator YafY